MYPKREINSILGKLIKPTLLLITAIIYRVQFLSQKGDQFQPTASGPTASIPRHSVAGMGANGRRGWRQPLVAKARESIAHSARTFPGFAGGMHRVGNLELSFSDRACVRRLQRGTNPGRRPRI